MAYRHSCQCEQKSSRDPERSSEHRDANPADERTYHKPDAKADHCPREWPAPGSEDTELGVFMGPEVRHGEAEVYARVQA